MGPPEVLRGRFELYDGRMEVKCKIQIYDATGTSLLAENVVKSGVDFNETVDWKVAGNSRAQDRYEVLMDCGQFYEFRTRWFDETSYAYDFRYSVVDFGVVTFEPFP